MANKKEKLLSDFPPITTDEWVAKITADLKGAPFDKKLVWRTPEGFDLYPFYRMEDIEGLNTAKNLPAQFPYVRSTRMDNEWTVRQDLVVEDLSEANIKALDLLQRGVTALGFKLKRDQTTVEALEKLLKDIVPEAVELHFSCCQSVVVKLAKALAEYLSAKSQDPAACRGSINYNPFKKQLVRGVVKEDWATTAKEILLAVEPIPGFRVLHIDAYLLADAGAYITQQLGFALAWGQQLLDTLSDEGYSIDTLGRRIQFNFGVGTNYFMEIAKFRAARWLWAEIVGAYGDQYKGDAAKIYMHAISTTWNKTLYDSYVNLLRTQTETMSASLGGVNSITVLPFDGIYQQPDEFSERIARNQQLLLKEECNFDKVIDPSAGSYYIEHLTNSIATEGWKLFLSVIEDGGFCKQANEGKVQAAVNASNAKRHEAVARRKESLLGTNQFPNFTELVAGKVAQTEEKSAGKHGCGCGGCNSTIEALSFSRAASDFEDLRLSTERSGKTPTVFMLTIGNLAMRLARSQFSSNFFACAGYKLIDNLGFETVEEGVDAAMKAGADIVCLCSSDDEYATYAIPAYRYLNGRAEFVVAGAPACMPELQEAGIKDYVNVKSNVLEVLQDFNKRLGINA
ncbi:methylmalonyl-CoA mutase [Porphyromonas crevioricanis]|uniref:Methylmalonyl-CoA mutase small subunit n=2 Tax=Porphyromonas crevioricanis TaxID=393921 RepID=A0A0A2G0Q5_9PORP|nr:methylmalonyl-CoA mutase small subunit [Porphyromonas crevioricanis]KGN88841.1 methylmalonyl-CoA mutase [Porphyromonas crevioricanis]KGN95915.1 methylmalonyl-CoA mutase [Porphyromonas crevioricanis]SJZ72263.1 methylmalonyl-CoA mutase [Porphyromonas crevioricanis]SQH73531.1 Methylmalonyl-CoA mutase small subunit [Porphyromonas crevioricanis]GAD06148.1 Methylmalonyl-CoA mutase [Porphyromonas crevioricanis JCM 15906]